MITVIVMMCEAAEAEATKAGVAATKHKANSLLRQASLCSALDKWFSCISKEHPSQGSHGTVRILH